jgi:hypothetical protein
MFLCLCFWSGNAAVDVWCDWLSWMKKIQPKGEGGIEYNQTCLKYIQKPTRKLDWFPIRMYCWTSACTICIGKNEEWSVASNALNEWIYAASSFPHHMYCGGIFRRRYWDSDFCDCDWERLLHCFWFVSFANTYIYICRMNPRLINSHQSKTLTENIFPKGT